MPPPMGLPVKNRAAPVAEAMDPAPASEASPSAASQPGKAGRGEAADTRAVAAAGGEGRQGAEDGGEGEEAAEEVEPALPAGFFDDPEEDARARGVETPAERAKRELEEGLKKFEKEMAVEQEKAEETRHELDEERFEDQAQEENDFQSALLGRIQALRKKKDLKVQESAAKAAETARKAAEDTAAAEAVAENEDDSGSDVDFDWRSKGFE